MFFDNCDLYRSEFDKAIANKADFEPVTTIVLTLLEPKLKALFAKAGLKRIVNK
jgi:hypothetical protein